MSDAFNAEVGIRRNADGALMVYLSNHERREEDGTFADFIWSEGNFSCDCNRHDFFEQAAGRETGDDDIECGEGAYSVLWIKDPATGEILYSEED